MGRNRLQRRWGNRTARSGAPGGESACTAGLVDPRDSHLRPGCRPSRREESLLDVRVAIARGHGSARATRPLHVHRLQPGGLRQGELAIVAGHETRAAELERRGDVQDVEAATEQPHCMGM